MIHYIYKDRNYKIKYGNWTNRNKQYEKYPAEHEYFLYLKDRRSNRFKE